MDYRDYNDYELIHYISENSEEANDIIFKKYEPLIVNTAKKMIRYTHNSSLELNDLIQEGMLALNDATHTFASSHETIFYTYAKACIENRMISVVIGSNRLKHKILNDSISIESTSDDGDRTNIEYLFKNEKDNPENIILSEEYKQGLIEQAKAVLTPLELQVFELKINGFQYKEIAEMLDKDPKSIDNAIQRIKNKLKEYIEKENY